MSKTDIPAPMALAPGDRDTPFWEACARSEFLLHRCDICGRHDWPASCCVTHGAAPMRWVPASGMGVVDTYTAVHHAYDPAMADEVPYTVAVIILDEGPFFHTRLLDVAPEAVRRGLRVELTWRDTPQFGRMPYFRPRTANGPEAMAPKG